MCFALISLSLKRMEGYVMSDENNCPKCGCTYTYFDSTLWVCPECAHEWNPEELAAQEESSNILDANGNMLQDGDSITVIKDLKVKGASSGVKSGTKVKNIRLVESNDGHNISCKVNGVGAMFLKSEFVKKA